MNKADLIKENKAIHRVLDENEQRINHLIDDVSQKQEIIEQFKGHISEQNDKIKKLEAHIRLSNSKTGQAIGAHKAILESVFYLDKERMDGF